MSDSDHQDTLAIVREVKPDWVVWSYNNPGSPAIDEKWNHFTTSIQDSDVKIVQGALSPIVNSSSASFTEEACYTYKTVDGKQQAIMLPWLPQYAFLDVNSPKVLSRLLIEAESSILVQQRLNNSKFSFHFDISGFLAGISGGCFGKYSVKKFGAYLANSDTLSLKDRREIYSEINKYGSSFTENSILNFNYAKYLDYQSNLDNENSRPTPSTRNWNKFHEWDVQSVLHNAYIKFQRESVVEFYENMREGLHDILSTHKYSEYSLSFSGNIHALLKSQQPVDWLINSFDFIQVEIYRNDQKMLSEVISQSLKHGKFLSVNLIPESDYRNSLYLINKEQAWSNNHTIALVYSIGGGVIFPWDIYTGSDGQGNSLPRYYGKYEEWPIFNFLAEYKTYIKGRHFSCSTMRSIPREFDCFKETESVILNHTLGISKSTLESNNLTLSIWKNTGGCDLINLVRSSRQSESGLSTSLAKGRLFVDMNFAYLETSISSRGDIIKSKVINNSNAVKFENNEMWKIIEFCREF